MVLPSWPTTVPSGVANSSQPRPQWVPIRPRSGNVTWGSCIAATLSADRTWVPSAAAPLFRCMVAKDSRSRGRIASIAPAGTLERTRAHIGAGTRSASGSGSRWPTAARKRIAS